MAQYDEDIATITDNITKSGLSTATKSSIDKIVKDSISAGQTTVKVQDYDGKKADAGTLVVNVGKDIVVTEDPGAPVIIMSNEAAQGANVTLDASMDRTVVATNQADKITFTGNSSVTVETGGGNDAIATSNGSDLVTVTGNGDSTVTTGAGNDKVVVQGEGKVQVEMTSGNNVVVLQSATAEVSVTGGTGFDQVQIAEGREAHHFTVAADGTVVMNSNKPITMDNVQVVGFDVNGDGKIEVGVDQITVLADSHGKSVVAKLYEVAFNREADMGGIEYWMGRVDQGDSLDHIVRSFINSEEFNTAHAAQNNTAFVESLYQNLAGRAADAEGLAYWLGRLDSGESTRADVAWSFAESDEAQAILGIDGSGYVVDLF